MNSVHTITGNSVVNYVDCLIEFNDKTLLINYLNVISCVALN